MDLFTHEHPFVTGRDVSSFGFWTTPLVERDETFAWLRANAPVSWHPPMEEVGLPNPNHGEKGFWAVTRAEDIHYVSQNHQIFSSALGGVNVAPVDQSFRVAPSMLELDPPRHSLYRNIISSAFTPKGVARIAVKIEERAKQIVSAVSGAGEFDFAQRVSARLPMLTVADMVGVPDSEIERFTVAGNSLVVSSSDQLPEGTSGLDNFMASMMVLREIGQDLVEHRRRHPADDIATALAQAEIDGRPLTDDEILTFVGLLASAGNDTTRHTTSWTAVNLSRNPDQKRWLLEDFEGRIGLAVEEFVRHATVVNFFARTATEDTELGGQKIDAGDKVAIFYCSGNRDETLFPDPHRFDLSRPRTVHVAFGGRGVHFCLGNVVAKAQVRAIVGQMLSELPDLEIAGEPVLMRTPIFNAIEALPARA